MDKTVTVLGSTGSIGTQTLDVIRHLGLRVHGLTCGSNIDLLLKQVKEFKPSVIGIADTSARDRFLAAVKEMNSEYEPRVLSGEDASRAIAAEKVDVVVAAMVGFSGLVPVLDAIDAGNDVALANKETLVAGGDIVMRRVREKGVKLFPVDSEHSAIWQCLRGEKKDNLKSIILTASGGPFRDATIEELRQVTVEQALDHPVWSMGKKITIDSATLMNKGLEMIEAAHLFDLTEDQIDVAVHPQGIVHSLVTFKDGGLLAQLGYPDMRLPIQLALTWPDRVPLPEQHDWRLTGQPALTFDEPDDDRFPALKLARHAIREGGLLPAVLNAANEVAVYAFLDRKIGFTDITRIVTEVTRDYEADENSVLLTVEDIIDADRRARQMARERIERNSR